MKNPLLFHSPGREGSVMIISVRRFRMKRVLHGFVILFLVFVPIVWWTYSKFYISMVQEYHLNTWKHTEEEKRTNIKMVSYDIENNEVYPVDIRHVSVSMRRNVKKILRQKYEDEKKYGKENKKTFQSKKTEEDKRTNKEMISNNIEEVEIYPIDIRHIPESIRKKYEKIPNETHDEQKYLDNLNELLHGDELTKSIEFEKDFLRLYLLANDYKIEQAFSKIQNFLKLRINHDYFFHNMTFDFTELPEYRFVTILPHRRKDGSVTLMFEVGKWDPDKVPLVHLKQIMFMMAIQTLRNPVTQASGFNFIYDFAGVGFKYLKYATPDNFYLLHHVSFEVLPAKFVGYHLVNINVFGNIMVTLTRPFIPKFIEKIFYTHSSVEELHDFYPTSTLPVQYGGNLTDYYAADWIREANKQHGMYPAGGQKNIF